MKLVVLGLGSNKKFGSCDSVELLKKACEHLKLILNNLRMSCVYRTKPMYYENQDDFYNMVVCGYVEDSLSPCELLKIIHKIESTLGRDRSREIRNGPRPIDIDIEFFGDEIVNTKELQIPHPRISERAFVLIPLLEIFQKHSDIKMKKNFFENIGNLDFNDVEIYCSSENFI